MAVAVAVVSAFLLAVPQSAGSSEGATDYRSRVSEAWRLVASANPRTPAETGTLATRLDALLPPTERVQTDDGFLALDNSVLAGLTVKLARARTNAERQEALGDIRAHLETLRDLVGDTGTPGAPVREDPSALARLVAEREAAAGSPISAWLRDRVERLLRWLSERVERLQRTRSADTVTRVLQIGILVVLLLLLAWVAFLATRAVRRATARRSERSKGAQPPPVVPAAEELPTDALAHAAALAATGRFREAVRALFGDSARSLVGAGLVRQTRTLTNSELLAEARHASPEVASGLAGLCARFEVAWYGHRDPGETGYREALREHAAIAEALAEHAARDVVAA